jgi:hypothetical protein
MNKTRIAASAAVITAALIAALIAALSAGAMTTRGSIHIYGEGNGGNSGQFVITGAIDGAGTSRTSVTDHGRVSLLTASLPKGKLVVDVTKLRAAVAKGLDSGDPTTCSAAFRATVRATILRGTGPYTGASGNLSLHASVAAVAPKASNGQCGAISPVSLVDWVQGSGTVSFK